LPLLLTLHFARLVQSFPFGFYLSVVFMVIGGTTRMDAWQLHGKGLNYRQTQEELGILGIGRAREARRQARRIIQV
jgi:hypothetical protein